MKPTLFSCLAAVLLLACNNDKKGDNPASAGTKTDTPAAAKPAPDPEAMMKAWVDFSTPGPEHQWMASHNGTWVCDSLAQWMDPSQPPSYSKATDVLSSKMKGLYQLSEFSSVMGGEPFSGMGTLGFDRLKKKFVLSWIDNVGSGIVRMEGTYDEATKTLNMKGKQSDPGLQAEADIRQEMQFPDENTYIMTMYGQTQEGKEAKFLQGTFRRKK